mmetsp:Transcript_35720/g.79463  ORF Transcript_35720/g.79463 Transcript_35720/m.79463 type:complete len:288 (-) Transcript_35720:233-1096(-)
MPALPAEPWPGLEAALAARKPRVGGRSRPPGIGRGASLSRPPGALADRTPEPAKPLPRSFAALAEPGVLSGPPAPGGRRRDLIAIPAVAEPADLVECGRGYLGSGVVLTTIGGGGCVGVAATTGTENGTGFGASCFCSVVSVVPAARVGCWTSFRASELVCAGLGSCWDGETDAGCDGAGGDAGVAAAAAGEGVCWEVLRVAGEACVRGCFLPCAGAAAAAAAAGDCCLVLASNLSGLLFVSDAAAAAAAAARCSCCCLRVCGWEVLDCGGGVTLGWEGAGLGCDLG